MRRMQLDVLGLEVCEGLFDGNRSFTVFEYLIALDCIYFQILTDM